MHTLFTWKVCSHCDTWRRIIPYIKISPYGYPTQPRKGWLHHKGLRLLLFLNSGVGSFMSHWNQIRKGLWDETYGFSSLSEKTKKSKHLQISLQRQHFLLSCFWRPWVYVGPTGVEPPTFHPADPHSPNWANQAVVNFSRNWKITKGL